MKDRIEPNLYEATARTYRKAVDEGFGTVKFGHPDFDFLNALKHNTDVLAAFKTHRQQNDLAALMTDEEGRLKPFARFKQDVVPVIGKYNRNWLSTEYNTAVVRARHAARWKDFERDADLYPNLKWLETNSPHPDLKVHARYWNRVWPMTDPFWKKHYPGDRWNCKCGITNTDEAVTDNSDVYLPHATHTRQPDAGIDSNSGISGEVFTSTHPYIKQAYDGAEQAVAKLIQQPKRYIADREYGEHLLVSVDADLTEVEENKRAAKALLKAFPGLHIKIAEHVRKEGHKNPEYQIDNLIADRKGIESENGVTAGFRKAIEQGCKVVVIDLDMHMADAPLRSVKLSKKIDGRHADFTAGIIDRCYLIYRGKAVVIDRNLFLTGYTDAERRKQIMETIEQIKD